MYKTRLFGGICKVTLATSSATWDVDFQGPGIVKEDNGKFSVHTEFGEAIYDRRSVVGFMFGLPDKEGDVESNDDETDDDEDAPVCEV